MVGVEVPCVGGALLEAWICGYCVDAACSGCVCSGMAVKGGVSGEGCCEEECVQPGGVLIPGELAWVGGSSFSSCGGGEDKEVAGRDLADGQSELPVCGCGRVS